MRRKVFSYLSAYIVSAYVVYLEYSFLQWASWKSVLVVFGSEVDRYSVYSFVRYLFYLTGAFIILFYSAYFIFYLYYRSNEGLIKLPRFYPTVSIVVPAHNEAMNIERFIESVEYQDYPRELVEVIIVDDGSQDETSEIASKYGVKIIRHEKNLGKAQSLEDGIKSANGEVVLTMDADSYFGNGYSLRRIVESLYERPFIGISTGVIRIEQRFGSLLEKFQEIEFLHSFEVGRRVQGYLGWLLVVSGAFSAFKSYFIKSLPALPKDTLAEDFDLTVIAFRVGLDSNFEPGAIVYTEPEMSWKRLYRQRIRWYYGGLQVLSKHHDLILNRKYGEKGLFMFLHLILLEYVLAVLQIIGMILLPLIVLSRHFLGIAITDINLPPDVMAFLFLVVISTQYLPAIFMSTVVVAIERSPRRALRNFPAIFLYYLLYNPLLSLAKLDATLRFLRGVDQEW
ncbi:Glycosyltransferases involved in cell wall biogenesis [Thermococcus sp. 2319x1]|uniref:glycosyltransferase n=1 Tax=Thermococcus sp. 2319x1 TaxID=1674923 RepID=UPI00073A9260|nr:glycosyltransferase [Thermococcus sp. 2319x1]ALV63703.1 Glycosyltransferases involved in cell wall biogenesis [Thermococcus sp. 2319x1]